MITTITSITIFISLFLAFYLITVTSKNKLSNRLFSLFLILSAIDTSGIIIDEISPKPYNIIIFKSTFAFLQIPVFYLYIKAACFNDFKLKRTHLTHSIPFIITNLILIPRFYSKDIDSKIRFLKQHKYMFEIQFNHIVFHVQFICYIIVIFLMLRKIKKVYLENYSGISIKTYNWLIKLSLALSFIYTVALFKNIVKFSSFSENENYFKVSVYLLLFLSICWYLYKALNNPELFKQIDSSLVPVKNNIVQKEATTNILEHEQKNIVQLQNYMKEHKPFLDPSLTIQHISDAIDIPVRELSLLINHKLNQHFYDFVNSYRINYAKNILSDPTQIKRTVLEVLYDSGFNSKSSFNTAFKKETGTTPSAYRKNLTIST